MTRWPEKVRGLNFFAIDRNLEHFLRRTAPGMLARRGQALHDLGAFAGGRLDRQAEASDRNFRPALHMAPDGSGNRRGVLHLNAEYEDCQQELYRNGLVAACFDAANPETHILPFVAQYLVSQADIATGCPFAMTHPVAYVLDRIAPPAVKGKFLPEILRTDGKTAVCGTWATEKHSGSDVGGTVTRAAKQADGSFTLHGHNWFTSAFGFKKFLGMKTARPDGAAPGGGGLGLYLVPSHTDDFWQMPNDFNITHLKDKLGTRGLPTVEVDLDGARAYEIAPAGQGLKAMMTALGCSRVHNAMAAAGVMHRAYREALCWADNRVTFGKPIVQRPMIQKRIMEIGVQWMGGSALAFEAARSFDVAANDPSEAPWMRIVTALAKFRTAEQAVWCAQKALELVGGNGYTEDYATARLFRDAMVLPVWEGPEQIQALELMRFLSGSEPGDALFLDKLHSVAESLPGGLSAEKKNIIAMANALEPSLRTLRANPRMAEQVADDFLRAMSDTLAYALLCEEAAWELSVANDATKLLAARAWHETVSGAKALPSFAIPPMQKHFNDIAAGRPVRLNPPAPGGDAPAFKP